jgi:hypothetical protein
MEPEDSVLDARFLMPCGEGSARHPCLELVVAGVRAPLHRPPARLGPAGRRRWLSTNGHEPLGSSDVAQQGASFAGSALLALVAAGFRSLCCCAAAACCEASRSRVGGLGLDFAALARPPGNDLSLLQELQSRLRRCKQGRLARLSGTTDADDLQQLSRGDREP